ncbi:class I SAM-dependent methyltransferase [Streptosporangium lutulentum]
MAASTDPEAPSYAFDNNDPEAAHRHDYLASMLDGLTGSRLAELGDLTGRRCLEIGAGAGSIAAWLAKRTGPEGRVLATDVNTRHLPLDAGFDVRRHDIVSEPVPEGPWDVIHARLVLVHFPERHDILRRLAAALAPGGALVVEDFENTFRKGVLSAPTPEAEGLLDAYQDSLVRWAFPAHGIDPAWAAGCMPRCSPRDWSTSTPSCTRGHGREARRGRC